MIKYKILISMVQIVNGISAAFKTDQHPQAETKELDESCKTLS